MVNKFSHPLNTAGYLSSNKQDWKCVLVIFLQATDVQISVTVFGDIELAQYNHCNGSKIDDNGCVITDKKLLNMLLLIKSIWFSCFFT